MLLWHLGKKSCCYSPLVSVAKFTSISSAESIVSIKDKEDRDNGNNSRNVPLCDNSFRVYSASILVRNPITLRSLEEFERVYEEYREGLQSEYSRGAFDIMTAHKLEISKIQGESMGTREKERWVTTLAEYSSLPKAYVEADKDHTSLMRKLERKLYFVIKNEDDMWQFPSTFVAFADQPLHKHSSKMLQKLLGKEFEMYHIGRAPVAFHKQVFPDRNAPPYGHKTFFFRSQIVNGKLNFTPNFNMRSFAWFTKNELKEFLPVQYYSSVESVLSY